MTKRRHLTQCTLFSAASCRSPLGIESGVIPDNGLLASPAFGGDVSTYGPQKARLHLNRSGYRAATSSLKANETWIEVKLAKETIVTGISTQGHGDTTLKEWVTKYSLMFSTGSDFFHFKETNGAIKVRDITGKVSLLSHKFLPFHCVFEIYFLETVGNREEEFDNVISLGISSTLNFFLSARCYRFF